MVDNDGYVQLINNLKNINNINTLINIHIQCTVYTVQCTQYKNEYLENGKFWQMLWFKYAKKNNIKYVRFKLYIQYTSICKMIKNIYIWNYIIE